MRLHDALLEQARQLARIDPTRPRQASLRRAVSTSYYALFHLLTEEAAGLYVSDDEFMARVCRTYNHADMKKVSIQFAAGKFPKAIQPQGTHTMPPDLMVVAEAFFLLQQARHEADYDRMREYTRSQALGFADQAQNAMEAWGRVKKTDDARLYVACFLLWDRWEKDPR